MKQLREKESQSGCARGGQEGEDQQGNPSLVLISFLEDSVHITDVINIYEGEHASCKAEDGVRQLAC